LAILLVTWGIVPTQAGIFSTQLISRSQEVHFDRSTAFVPASKQEANITYQYAESVYGIAVLNETLTSYMARNYTLAPFRPSSTVTYRLPDQGNWTAETWMYSLDMHCERPIRWVSKPMDGIFANSSDESSFSQGLKENQTFGMIDYLKWVNEPYKDGIFANSSNGCSFSQVLNGNLTFGMIDYFSLPSQSPICIPCNFFDPKDTAQHL
jgi:hypothetical protein